jgi:predicted negative regulator of RcsB-dependent stress response
VNKIRSSIYSPLLKQLFYCSLVLILFSGCGGYLNDYQSSTSVYNSSTRYPYKNNPVENSQIPDGGNAPNALSNNSKQLSPAVLALLAEADNSSKRGDLDSAVITLERALRIDSRNPILIYKLAKLRLHQLKPRLAEDLAKKGALLSGSDKVLKRNCWLLVSEAREQQGNHFGADEAKERARNLID